MNGNTNQLFMGYSNMLLGFSNNKILTFYGDNGEKIGEFNFNKIPITFTGNADESAQLFIDFVKNNYYTYTQHLLERTRETIFDGKVVTIAKDFNEHDDALGSLEVSASRNAVIVHRAECRTIEDIDLLIDAIKCASAHQQALLSS